LNVLGTGGITTTGSGNTITIDGSGVTGDIKFEVDAHTAPGTNPVLPTSGGLTTITGGQVPAGTTSNVIQTNSLAANTYTVQVQRATTAATSTVADNGVSHFNSNEFTVDSNGFVQLNTVIHNFTPTAFGATTAGTTTYSYQSGSYTRIGGIVVAQLSMSWTAATGTGNLTIGGFPYKFGGGQNRAPTCSVLTESLTFPMSTTCLVGIGADATTTLAIDAIQSGSGEAPMQMQNAGFVALSIIYQTADAY
jgi:hypothetical protein